MKHEHFYLPHLTHHDMVVLGDIASSCHRKQHAVALGEWIALIIDDELKRRTPSADAVPKEFTPFDPPIFDPFDCGRGLSFITITLTADYSGPVREFLLYCQFWLTVNATTHLCRSKPLYSTETELCRG